MLRRPLLTALLSALLASSAHAGSGPITSVKLSSGGVAEIVRTAAVDETGTIEIDVPLEQVDDLLKSLAVFSSKAAVQDLSLAGPQPMEETFARLPFTPEDLNSLSRIIGAMKGSKVTIDGQTDIVYTVVGVEKIKDQKAALVLLTPKTELKTVILEPTTTVKFVEPEAQKKIDDAVALLAASAADGMRTIKVRLAKTDEREVAISYVVAAPVWKPTYKLVVQDGGKARLQAWAVLENASGEDWNDVEITLSSGKPVTLKQRLHERVWKNRDEIGAEDTKEVAAQARRIVMNLAEAEFAGFAGASAAAPYMAETVAPASGTEELAMANFTLPGKFTVRNGDTLSVPIVDKEVDAGFVSLFNPNATHPDAALLISNGTGNTLPSGIMTVYDARGGYVGDARFDDIAAGASKTSVFGSDLKMDQMVERQVHETVTAVKLADWKLEAQKISTITATWKVKAGDEGRTVVVEDGVPDGYSVAPGQIVEETPRGVRLKAAVKPGETVSLVVKYQREEREEMVAADPDEGRIALWISGTADEAVKAKLQGVLDATAALGEASRKLQLAHERYGEIEREQARIRGNLSGVDDAALKRRWISRMTELEDELETLVDERQKVEESIELLRKKLGDRVRTF